jgi:hypothetical protein
MRAQAARVGMLAAILLLVGVAAAASPQSPATDWNDVQLVPSGARVVVYARRASQRVRVEGTAAVRQLSAIPGRQIEITGVLVDVDADELVIAPRPDSAEQWIVRRQDVARILRIETTDDSIANGLLWGAGIGAGSWLVLGLGDRDFDATSPVMLGLGAAIGAVIGVGADDLYESETTVVVYQEQPPGLPAPTATAPTISPTFLCRASSLVGPITALDPVLRRETALVAAGCVAAARIALEDGERAGHVRSPR